MNLPPLSNISLILHSPITISFQVTLHLTMKSCFSNSLFPTLHMEHKLWCPVQSRNMNRSNYTSNIKAKSDEAGKLKLTHYTSSTLKLWKIKQNSKFQHLSKKREYGCQGSMRIDLTWNKMTHGRACCSIRYIIDYERLLIYKLI